MFAFNFHVSKITETIIRSLCQPRAEAREKAEHCLSVIKNYIRAFHIVPPFQKLTVDGGPWTMITVYRPSSIA
jgi:hypothetical protein